MIKIRLARRGRKGAPVYHIVVADAKAPRDGRFIEKVGVYNINSNPSTVTMKTERILYWLEVGAQPTPTTRRLLSFAGLMLTKHLLEGIRKGAINKAIAHERLVAWKAPISGGKEPKYSFTGTTAMETLIDRLPEHEVASKKSKKKAVAPKKATVPKKKAKAAEKVVKKPAFSKKKVNPAEKVAKKPAISKKKVNPAEKVAKKPPVSKKKAKPAEKGAK